MLKIPPDTDSLASDRLDGAAEIARYLGISERKCRYQMSRGLIPHGRVGNTFVASKAALREHYRKLTNGTAAKAGASEGNDLPA